MAPWTPQGDPFNGEVVRLRRAAQEDDAVGAPPDQPAHLGASRPEGIAGFLPQAVSRPGVTDPTLQKGSHDAKHPGVHRGKPRVVEIDPSGRANAPSGPI